MIDNIFRKEYFKVRNEYFEELIKLKPEKGLKDIESFKQKAYWAFNFNEIKPQIHIIFGNAKLPDTTCIINLGTWFNCPARKNGMCDICNECYDKQIEVRFKQRTRDRLEHEIFWRTVGADLFADLIIWKILDYQQKTNKKVKLIRWAEVGDIRNQKDLIKIIKVSNIIHHALGIKSYIYTHNKNLNFDIHRPNLVINGSNFMVDNEYRVVKNREDEYQQLEDIVLKKDCICDCNNCSLCSEKNNNILIEELR